MRKFEAMKKLLSLLLCAVLVMGMLPIPALAAEGDNCTSTPDCTGTYGADGICMVCGAAAPAAGDGAGDSDNEETCQHSGGTATCTAQAVCELCGAPYGELADHAYGTDADGKCDVCGGDCAHENYSEGVCTVCGKTEPHTHTYVDGVCGCGEVCAHAEYVEGVCTVCGAAEPVQEESEPVCVCEVSCGGDNGINPDCTVCLEDFWNCTHFVPTCTCAEKCSEEEPNLWCAICGTEGAEKCEGEDKGVPYDTTYTVTFDVNGGTGTFGPATTDSNGKLTALPDAAPVRQGFTFLGWYDAQTDGNKIETSTEFTDNTTVYAQWQLITEHTVDLTDRTYYCGVVNSDTVNVSELFPADTTASSGLGSSYAVNMGFFSGVSITMAETMETQWKVLFKTQATAPAGEDTLTAIFDTSYGTIKVHIKVKLTELPSDRYIINVAEAENGKVTASALTAMENETITVEATPDSEKYVLDTLKYNDGATDTNITGTNGEYSFTMPAKNVTISATFKKVITDPVYVGGIAMVPGKLYVNGNNGSVVESTDENWNAKLEGDEESGYTLYINGLSVNGVTNTNSSAGIFYNGEASLTIQVSGVNTVTAATATNTNSSSNAIYSKGNLTITGGGTLTAVGNKPGSFGTSTGIRSGASMSISGVTVNASTQTNTNTKYSYGIYAFNNLNISGSTVTASSETATDASVGIYACGQGNTWSASIANSNVSARGGVSGIECWGNQFTVSGANTEIVATGGSYGLSTRNSKVTVNGGSILAKGDTQASRQKLVCAEDLETLASETIDGELTIQYDPDQNGDYKAVQVAPAPATTYTVTIDSDIQNGTVTANPTSAAEGETVTLTVTPAEGYELDTLSYSDGTNTTAVTKDDEGKYTFTMPASNVTVTATFKLSHVHDWQYQVKNGTTNTIEAVCKNEDNNCDNTDGGTLMISAPEHTVYGDGKAANATTSGTLPVVTASPDIQYQKQTGTDTWDTATTTAPENAGTYRASITVDNATAYVEYTVEKAVPTITGATATGRTYEKDNVTVEITGLSVQGYVGNDDIRITATKGTLSSDNAGTYTQVTLTDAQLTGNDKNNYKLPENLTVSTSVTISPKELTKENVQIQNTLLPYDANKTSNVPTVIVKDGDYTLVKDTDYVIVYKDEADKEVAAPNAVGKYMMYIQGVGGLSEDGLGGNYQGGYQIPFQISNAPNVANLIAALPDPSTVEPDDKATIDAYVKAKTAYDALPEADKNLIAKDAKEKLEKVGKALTAYDIIKGHKSNYVKGSYKALSFTANGYFGKFVGVEVDGKLIDEKYYTAESGSTIITLKTGYLESLKTGKHYIQVNYTDGNTGGEEYFRVTVNNGSPQTGDDNHLMLFGGIMLTSLLGMAMMVMFIPRKKGKYER